VIAGPKPVPNVLTIAGSDPSGGAGIQADLKAISALGGYAMAVVTALTAQNTREVRGVHVPPAAFLTQQLDAVFDDVRVDAVKVGMLASAELIVAVADCISARRPPFVVVDPVMISKSGHALLAPDAVAALASELLPRAHLLTPNLPEAAQLHGDHLGPSARFDLADGQLPTAAMEEVAEGMGKRWGVAVLLKGGHGVGPTVVDVLFDGRRCHRFEHARIETRHTHGTGCTLSSAIATLAAHPSMTSERRSLEEVIGAAIDYVHHAILAADELAVGSGHGPLQHFHGQIPMRLSVAARPS
jgi:hydroxymethylpyrimidine kinase/phosphomethylpyrimidine kinase